MVRRFGTALFVALVAGSIAPRAAANPEADANAAKCCPCGTIGCPGCHPKALPCDRHQRSGYGLCVAPWARWTYNCNYLSYYVGGSARPRHWGKRVRPEPRYPWEGTWGTDYSPCLTASELWWTHGRLYQDGGGQYEPDRRNLPFFLKFGR